MKKKTLLTLLYIAIAFISNAQAPIITINNAADPQSDFGPEQLIEDVLVSGGCSGASNFSFQVNGQPNDRNTKSYGYFNKRLATGFPFEEGVILTTGRASGGGNSIIPDPTDGAFPNFENGLPGDSDLETALGTDKSTDATFIKFDFVPAGDNISFRFLMASEEYDGSKECSFTDGFAFLLREVGTATYTNLAVLPDGTPVNVRTINDATNCKANTEFFEGYDVPDTNYGGRTKVLTASATVRPGITYEIKLVVADQRDQVWDSAIFLEAGSFNLGGDLGPDKTIIDGTAICGNDTITLDTNSPTGIHEWFLDGVAIGDDTQFLTVTESGTYSVNIVFGGGCSITGEEIVIEFFPEVTIAGVDDLRTCSAGSISAIFDLTENNDNALGMEDPMLFNISYYTTPEDADNKTNAIENPENYTGTNQEMIYLRLESNQTQCFDTEVFNITVDNINFQLDSSYTICVDTDGTQVVTPPSIDTGLSEANYNFMWFLDGVLLTGPNANNGSYTPLLPGTYNVEVENITTGCMIDNTNVNATTVVNESTRPLLTVNQTNSGSIGNTILATAVPATTLTNVNPLFEFSLDGGPWNSEMPNNGTYTFKNVSAGIHTVEVRDIKGCGITSITVNVIGFPAYFTPNGDGFNDTWNMKGIANQPEARIQIFDRYGKLLKELSPSGIGWDGTFNNNLLPTDDYWFKVKYTEPNSGLENELTSHFTLKR